MATDLTAETIEGFDALEKLSTRDNPGGKRNPYLFSSDSWLAFEAGQALCERGLTRPERAHKSRGCSVRIVTSGQTEFLFKASGDDLEIMDLIRK